MTNPEVGQQYLLPSKQHVRVERIASAFRICCRYITPSGDPIPKRKTQADVTLTEAFLSRYALRVR